MTKQKVKLSADSSCMQKEVYYSEGIAPLQSQLFFNEKHHKDLDEIDRDDFVSKVGKMDPYPTSALASPQDALDIYTQAEKEGFEEVLYIGLHPNVSNQYNTAKVAAKKYEKEGGKTKVHLYQSGLMCIAQGAMAYSASQLAKKGKSSEEIIQYLDSIKENVHEAGCSADFQILFKTGKIKKGFKISMISTLMRLKPLTEVNLKVGPTGVGGAPGFKKALKSVIKNLEGKAQPGTVYDLYVADALAPKLKKKFIETIPKHIKINKVHDWKLPPITSWAWGKGSVMAAIAPTMED